MFDMGITEMMLIGVVALVVIGPERLPGVARTAGKYFARLRNFMTNVRADVESELKADELREMFEAQQQELQSLKEVVGDVGKDIGLSDITQEMSGIANSIDDEKLIPGSEAKAKSKAKAKAKAKPPGKAAAKSSAKPAARSKSPAKLKPKARPKSRVKPKADSTSNANVESNWTDAIVPPADADGEKLPRKKRKVAKSTRPKAK